MQLHCKIGHAKHLVYHDLHWCYKAIYTCYSDDDDNAQTSIIQYLCTECIYTYIVDRNNLECSKASSCYVFSLKQFFSAVRLSFKRKIYYWNFMFVSVPNVSFQVYAPGFISRFLESHAVMFQGNAGLKPKEGEVTSRPWQWPINYRVSFSFSFKQNVIPIAYLLEYGIK